MKKTKTKNRKYHGKLRINLVCFYPLNIESKNNKKYIGHPVYIYLFWVLRIVAPTGVFLCYIIQY